MLATLCRVCHDRKKLAKPVLFCSDGGDYTAPETYEKKLVEITWYRKNRYIKQVQKKSSTLTKNWSPKTLVPKKILALSHPKTILTSKNTAGRRPALKSMLRRSQLQKNNCGIYVSRGGCTSSLTDCLASSPNTAADSQAGRQAGKQASRQGEKAGQGRTNPKQSPNICLPVNGPRGTSLQVSPIAAAHAEPGPHARQHQKNEMCRLKKR